MAGKWYANALVFATRAEAEKSASDLMWRWTQVEESRAVESGHAVNTRMVNGHQEHIDESA